MAQTAPGKVISTILRHDAKVTSYKIALLRAINDVVLSFPDLKTYQQDVAIPLRILSEFWVAYYWGFVAAGQPILQGQQANRAGEVRNDMAFRPQLTAFRTQWEQAAGELSRPSDGFFIINELRLPRKRTLYPTALLTAYHQAISDISKTLEMPIRYAGPGNWTVFDKPLPYSQLKPQTIPIPGTQDRDKCLVIRSELWQSFIDLSLWVEALCIHEWCLFTERVEQPHLPSMDRGRVYSLLTDRLDNRRPLSWERNNIEILLLEGIEFTCPWTQRRIAQGTRYDLDHLVPLAVYPTNELWNLVPADPDFNSRIKRDRLPKPERLEQARPHLELAYHHYEQSAALAKALKEDVAVRFASLQQPNRMFTNRLAYAVISVIEQIAEARNLARF